MILPHSITVALEIFSLKCDALKICKVGCKCISYKPVTYWRVIDWWLAGELSVLLGSLASPSVPTGLLKLARPTDYPPVRPIQIHLQIEIQIYDRGQGEELVRRRAGMEKHFE